jgi:hypothetical protein
VSVPINEMPSTDPVWNEWADVSIDLCTTIRELLETKLEGRHREFKAAVYSSVIEELAERQRMFLSLPGERDPL